VAERVQLGSRPRRQPGQGVPEHDRRLLPRSVETAEADFINRVSSERAEDGKLSLELWTPNCGVCSVGNNLSYWARYYTATRRTRPFARGSS
jgi:hypothetical protein